MHHLKPCYTLEVFQATQELKELFPIRCKLMLSIKTLNLQIIFRQIMDQPFGDIWKFGHNRFQNGLCCRVDSPFKKKQIRSFFYIFFQQRNSDRTNTSKPARCTVAQINSPKARFFCYVQNFHDNLTSKIFQTMTIVRRIYPKKHSLSS